MFETEEILHQRFLPILRRLGPSCEKMLQPDRRFLIAETTKIEIYWAPFHTNRFHLARAKKAKVLFLGLTGGFHQVKAAYKQELRPVRGNPVSFGGPMRSHLLRLATKMGLHTALGLESLDNIFDDSPDADLFMSTSLLRFPVFRKPKLSNYSGSPSINSCEKLLMLARTYTGSLIERLPKGILIIPFGKAAQDGLLQALGATKPDNILFGFPHPSGGNGHRESLFRERCADLQRQIESFARKHWS